MYKVDYYITARNGEENIEDIKRNSNTWYTECFIENIPKALSHTVDTRNGAGKYIPVIMNIENIRGHL